MKNSVWDDLSLGTEPTPIRCECNTTGVGPPYPTAAYITRCQGADEETSRRLTAASTNACQCTAACECQDSEACGCCAVAAYDTNGKLIEVDAPPAWITECTDQCGCSSRCCNRVVGRGVQVPLTVFQTPEGRGWGVRSSIDLERGQFVCEYAGEIVSSAEASARRRKRARCEADGSVEAKADGNGQRSTNEGRHMVQQSMNFILSVLEHLPHGRGVLKTTIDPTTRGNVGRYINHSCAPNLDIVCVRVGSLVPSVAFFCNRSIVAGEELTFHYGGERTQPMSAIGHDLQGRRPCRCGAASCAGWLPFDPEADGECGD
jgi:histone-lysine N-methyltransferase SETMAR